MKTLLMIFNVLGFALVAFFSVSQQPKYYDKDGNVIEQAVLKNDSIIKSLPKTCTLTGLTKQDLRVFKNLMLQKVQESDQPYDNATRVVFDKIIADLNTKNSDTVKTYRIINLPTSYLIEYAKNGTNAYCNFVSYRNEARQFLRIAANVQRIDTAFYFFGNSTFGCALDKTILKRDLKRDL